MAAEIKVLSAGALEPGVAKAIDQFRRETGHDVNVAFATAPAIVKRLGGGETADVVIAPPAALDELGKIGQPVSGGRVMIGRIGIGVAVRDGAPAPKIATVDEFKQSLLSAESIVYNQASTGIYIESLFDRLGIAAQLRPKTTRYPDFAAVLEHVIKGKGKEIALGATTVIIEGQSRELKFAGPLPAEIQNYTSYAATVTADIAAAHEFVRYLTSPAAKAALASAGIE
ncbi:MAG TPA: substrate-binding domain-containing protein [Candidatus Binatia bacterium]